MIFRRFRATRGEINFLKFVLESARMLKKLIIVSPKGTFASTDEANFRLKPLFATKWVSKCCSLVVLESDASAGESNWNFERGCDFSLMDPFAIIIRSSRLDISGSC